MKNFSIINILAFVALITAGPAALAGYDEAAAAYEAGDYEAAFAGFQEAAQENHRQAQARLGELYRDGRGTEQDVVRAHMWMTIAYLRGASELRNPLATMRETMGEGQVAQSERMAIEWFEGGISELHEFWNQDTE
ncbi:MAG: hypothetical protein WEB57_11090 [Pseudohongiellaceae bacterium]